MVRRLWRMGGTLLALVVLPLGVAQVVVAVSHEETTIERTFPAEGLRTIEVRNSAGGPVDVVGTTRDTVSVRVRIDHGLSATSRSERIDGDRLVLKSSCPHLVSMHCGTGYQIEAPAGVDIVVHSDVGNVTVRDVVGAVDVETDAGDIRLTRIGGTVEAHSSAGSIEATGLRGGTNLVASSDAGQVAVDFEEPPGSVVATSNAGDVDVVLPRDRTPYQVTAESNAGGVTIDVLDDPSAERTVVASSDAGAVSVRYGASG